MNGSLVSRTGALALCLSLSLTPGCGDAAAPGGTLDQGGPDSGYPAGVGGVGGDTQDASPGIGGGGGLDTYGTGADAGPADAAQTPAEDAPPADPDAAPGTAPDADDLAADTLDDASEGPPDAAGTGTGSISVYLAGDLTPQEFGDGLAGQTPTDFFVGIARYEIMTTADPATSVLCFDHPDEPFAADLHEDNLVGACDTSSVPSGLYTYGRTKVDWATYTVEAELHTMGMALPGTYSFFRAYSDTTWEGVDYAAGEGFLTFSGSPGVVIPIVYPPPPDVPGTAMEVIDGEFWMTFPFTNPLPIDQNNDDEHWARSHWQIDQAFRWEDLDTAGYSDQVWDVSMDPAESEEVLLAGVAGYYVTSSID